MMLPLLDLPDTVLRALHWHLDVPSVLKLRQTSRLAAQSDLVLEDRTLSATLALISGNEPLFLQSAPRFQPYRDYDKKIRGMYSSHHLPRSGQVPFYRFACVLVRMDAPRKHWAMLRRWARCRTGITPEHHYALVAFALRSGSLHAIGILLQWKSRKGKPMHSLRYGYWIKMLMCQKFAAPGSSSHPGFAQWVLANAAVFIALPPMTVQDIVRPIAADSLMQLKVLARLLPIAGVPCAASLRCLELALPDSSTYSTESWRAVDTGIKLMESWLSCVAMASGPLVVYRALLAALVLSHVDWRPGHPLASDTAFQVDFGGAETDGVTALRVLLVESVGGDAAAAAALIAGFAVIPPLAARNGLIMSAHMCSSEPVRCNTAFIRAAVTIDPSSFATILDHEAVRPWTASAIEVDHGRVVHRPYLNHGHANVPLVDPKNGYTLNVVKTALRRCDGCRQAVIRHMTAEEAAVRSWGVVVHVPSMLSFHSQ
ncbi:hypothetical protein BC828DRAFT_378419 [Blastocladiella britannica]|nr:hypothetical protein BC828DRAFT_378419 [Blastocladiella britannica]